MSKERPNNKAPTFAEAHPAPWGLKKEIMINSTELRIGNLLNWEAEHLGAGLSKVIAVSEITFKVKSFRGLSPTMDEYKNIEPIPLTPEWLKRCGFIKLNHLGKKEYTLFIDESLSIEVCEYNELLVRLVISQENCDENINIGAFTVYRDINDCKHLHQLQNLYFVHTDKELTITLPLP